VTGEKDIFGPPRLIEEFLSGRSRLVVVPGADHFFEGKLDELETAVSDFLAGLAVSRRAR
jgi:alpha/beta superfamily hydrolase